MRRARARSMRRIVRRAVVRLRRGRSGPRRAFRQRLRRGGADRWREEKRGFLEEECEVGAVRTKRGCMPCAEIADEWMSGLEGMLRRGAWREEGGGGEVSYGVRGT